MPTPATSPSDEPKGPDAGTFGPMPLTAKDVVQFVQRYGLGILLTAGVAAVATALITSVLVKPTYQASATLVVAPSTFSSQLKPPTMSVQGYRTLLESDAVVAKLSDKLQREGLLEASAILRTGHELKSRIFVSRRAEQNALAPMIEAIVAYREPDKASTIANTWAEVFLDHTQELMAKATTPIADFVEAQYDEASQSLAEVETERARTAEELDKALNQLTIGWERKISRFRQNFEDRFARFQQETRQLFQQRRDEIEALGPRSVNAEAAEEALPDGEISERTKALLRRILVVREQLAQTPERLRLEKSISDDALWDALASGDLDDREGGSASGTLLGRSLLSEEVNPTYTELALRVTELEIELGGASDRVSETVEPFLSRLEELSRTRRTLLNKLLEERRSELEVLLSQRQVEIDIVSRSNMTRLAQLDRELTSHRQLVAQLSKNRNEARIARAQEDLADIRLGAAAVSPSRAESKRLPLKASIAGFIAGLVALVLALFREVATR